MPLVTLLAFVEAEIRHNADEEVLNTLDELWRSHKPTASITPAQRAQRMGALTDALAQ